MKTQTKKNVLVISIDPFSFESGNGKTLGNYFLGSKDLNVSQIYLSDYPIDMIDGNYAHIPELEVIKHPFRKKGKLIRTYYSPKVSKDKDINEIPEVQLKSKIKKNPLTCLARNFLWSLNSWKTKELKKFVLDIQPDVIVLQSGDAPFAFKIAYWVQKLTNAKLIVHNTEDFPFKKHNYLHKENGMGFLFPLYRAFLNKSYQKLSKKASLFIHNTEFLKDQFAAKYKRVNHDYVMCSSSYKPIGIKKTDTDKWIMLYAGGTVGGKRFESLIKVSDALLSISNKAFLKIFSTDDTDDPFNKQLIRQNTLLSPAINYDSLCREMEISDCLLHVENFNQYYRVDRVNGFSTKIADCLNSNKPFIIFAPKELACYRYLEKHDCAFCVDNEKDLEMVLEQIINNPNSLEVIQKIKNAKMIVEENHSLDKNIEKFNRLLLG